MSLSISAELVSLAHPETNGRQYPLPEEETKRLTDVIRACENSTFTLVNGLNAIGQLIEQVSHHQEAFSAVDPLTFARIGSLTTEMALMIDHMADTKREAKYVRDYNPEGAQS